MLNISKELMDFIMNIDSPERYREQEENLAYLRSIKVSPLLEYYLYMRLRHLYFDINPSECKGNAYSLMMNEQLNTYCFDSTVAVIPFLQPTDVIQRGTICPDSKQIIDHAWIKIKFRGDEYILDAALGLIVPITEYTNLYKQNIKGEVTSKIVTSKIIETFETSEPYYKDFYLVRNGNIDSAFYNTSLKLSGKYNKNKIKKLAVYIPINA